MTGQVWAYARVSTRDQNPQLQLDVLEASGYDTLVQEKESAKRGVLRPAWQEPLPLPQPGDTLKFWKSDRWGRSAADVLATVNQLRDRGVTVVSLTENFDLGTKEGRLMFGVLALAAEYELELRAERQLVGRGRERRPVEPRRRLLRRAALLAWPRRMTGAHGRPPPADPHPRPHRRPRQRLRPLVSRTHQPSSANGRRCLTSHGFSRSRCTGWLLPAWLAGSTSALRSAPW